MFDIPIPKLISNSHDLQKTPRLVISDAHMLLWFFAYPLRALDAVQPRMRRVRLLNVWVAPLYPIKHIDSVHLYPPLWNQYYI